MPRTKTYSSTKKKKKANPKTTKPKSQEDDSDSIKPKRLTVKQLQERRNLILETIAQSNKEFLEEKEKYLASQSPKKSPERKVEFNNVVKFSTGEEKTVDFK